MNKSRTINLVKWTLSPLGSRLNSPIDLSNTPFDTPPAVAVVESRFNSGTSANHGRSESVEGGEVLSTVNEGAEVVLVVREEMAFWSIARVINVAFVSRGKSEAPRRYPGSAFVERVKRRTASLHAINRVLSV